MSEHWCEGGILADPERAAIWMSGMDIADITGLRLAFEGVSRVEQEDANGCGAATVAMLTGMSYAEAKAFIGRGRSTSHRGDWGAEGITSITVDEALGRCGFYTQHRWISWYCERYEPPVTNPAPPIKWEARAGEQWPPEPWAPLHYATVQQDSGNTHFVVMLADGRVLDPYREGEFRLGDWQTVMHVTGLYHPEW